MTIDKQMNINSKLEANLNAPYNKQDLTVDKPAELLIYFYKYKRNGISATLAIEDLKMDK